MVDEANAKEPAAAPRPSEVDTQLLERYRCGRCPAIRVLAKPSFQPFNGQVYDVSMTSMGLIFDRPFEPDTVLAIQLQSRNAGFSGILSGQVDQCTQHEEGKWLVSCVLSRSLTQEEFLSLL